MKLFCLYKLITLKSESESRSVMSGSLRPHGLYMGWHSLLQGIFPTQGSNPGLPRCGQILYQLSHKRSPRILEWVAFPSPGDLPNPGIEPRSPTLQADSLPAEPQAKPKNTWVGSLAFLQGTFPIQEWSQDYLNCRVTFYQLSYQASPTRGIKSY